MHYAYIANSSASAMELRLYFALTHRYIHSYIDICMRVLNFVYKLFILFIYLSFAEQPCLPSSINGTR